MALLGKKKDSQNPVNILGGHIAAYLSWIKLGKTKFADKETVGPIFLEMDGVHFLLEQAVAGTMYDYRRKLEPNVWAAAMDKYGSEMEKLKAALLAAVDACEAAADGEDPLQKAEAEAAQKAELEKLSVREQMAIAEAKEKEEASHREEEEEQYKAEREASEATGKMTEADCRELWRIYQGMTSEMKEMQRIADRWIDENPPKGCLGVTLILLCFPLAAGAGAVALLR